MEFWSELYHVLGLGPKRELPDVMCSCVSEMDQSLYGWVLSLGGQFFAGWISQMRRQLAIS